MPGEPRGREGRRRRVLGTVLAALLAAGGAARTGATILLPADTNRAAVRVLELDYDPAAPRLRVAVTVSGNFVKRAEYRDREATGRCWRSSASTRAENSPSPSRRTGS